MPTIAAATPPAVRLYSALDLGQTKDPSALAVVEQTKCVDAKHPERTVAHYAVRHLERFKLGTSYAAIVDRCVALFGVTPLLGSTLGIDQTGVGRPVVDMLRRSGIRASLRPVTITSGQQAREDETDRGSWHVPKKDLVGVLQVLFQGRRIQVSRDLPDAKVLTKELQNFKVKITIAANETFEAWREGDHDDLVLAVAISCWLAERGGSGPINMEPIHHNPFVGKTPGLGDLENPFDLSEGGEW